MNILYLHQYFKTPADPGGTRSYWIAQELISRGHEVIMISSSSNIRKRKEVKNIDGIRVIYLRVPYDNSMRVFSRFIAFVRFMIASALVALKQKNVNLVIATSTPLTIGFPALVLNWIKKIPFLFEVRDLWPEVPIQMGGLKNPVLKKMAVAFEIKIYRNAKHIVALSPGMKEGIMAAGIKSEKISVIPNMAKIDQFWPREKNLQVLSKLNVRNTSFKVIHFGAMGKVNGLENFVYAAQLAKNMGIDDLDFILIGKGKMKPFYETMKKENSLDNLSIIEPLPMSEISEVVNICDVSYIGVSSKYPILKINSANKFFDSLSAGKPLLINFDGWMKDIIENYQCGIKAHESDPQDLLDKIILLKNNPKLVSEMGRNARKLAETKYDKSILCKEFVKLVESLKIRKKKG